MAKTRVKKYVDAPRFKVILSYEQDFTKSFEVMTSLMVKDIVNKAEKIVEQNGRSSKSDTAKK